MEEHAQLHEDTPESGLQVQHPSRPVVDSNVLCPVARVLVRVRKKIRQKRPPPVHRGTRWGVVHVHFDVARRGRQSSMTSEGTHSGAALRYCYTQTGTDGMLPVQCCLLRHATDEGW